MFNSIKKKNTNQQHFKINSLLKNCIFNKLAFSNGKKMFYWKMSNHCFYKKKIPMTSPLLPAIHINV